MKWQPESIPWVPTTCPARRFTAANHVWAVVMDTAWTLGNATVDTVGTYTATSGREQVYRCVYCGTEKRVKR